MSISLISSIENGIATLSLNRPDSLNAFNAEMRRELLLALQAAIANDDVRVVILRANGRAFCAGADLTEIHPEGQTVEQRLNNEYKPMLLEIIESPKPVIGAVQGAAAGIGCALAMSCDLIIMSSNAFYYQAFSALGIVPDGGITWHLPRQIGSKRAYEMMITGERLHADECLALGLVNRVVANDQLDAEAEALAKKLLSRAPLSMQYTKEAIRRATDLSLADTISMEGQLQQLLYQTEDYAEGKAAFLEKRKPVWKGK